MLSYAYQRLSAVLYFSTGSIFVLGTFFTSLLDCHVYTCVFDILFVFLNVLCCRSFFLCHLCVHSRVEFCESLLLVYYTPNDHMVTYNPVLKLVSPSVTRTTCQH